MELDKYKSASIWASVKEILEEKKENSFKVRLEGVLHTEDEDYDLYRIVGFHTFRDYTKAMMDDIQMSAYIPLGDYIYLVYGNKDHLEVTITTTYLRAVGDKEDKDQEIIKTRYKAILDHSNPTFETSDFSNVSQQALNLSQVLTIQFRLVDRNVEPLRVKMTQGVFRGVAPDQLIKGLLLGESQKVKIDGKPAVEGLDLCKPDKTETSTQVVIPSGTFICEIPTYLQERAGGVYKYGIGTYYQRYKKAGSPPSERQKPLWFVYPLYDHERFEGGKDRDVVTFFAAPSKLAGGVEKTFRTDSGTVEVVIATDKVTVTGTTVSQLNRGVGYRFADTNAFMKKPVKIKAGEAEAVRANLNREVGFMERKDGLQYVPVIKDLTSNPYHEISQVSTRQTSLLKFTWENAIADLLYPGMPAKYCYMQDNELAEVKGTVVSVHAATLLLSSIAEHPRYTTHCVVTVATNSNVKPPEYDKEIGYAVQDPGRI